MPLFKENFLGQKIWIKKLIIRFFGIFVWFRFNLVHRSELRGAKVFRELPDKKVIIISNHQTYFADVSFFYLVIYGALRGFPDNMRFPGFIFCRKTNLYYVAAQETMRSGFLPKILTLAGGVTINRSWRSAGENVRRKVDKSEVQNIDKAIMDGWVITFPQGTTAPYAKGRVGTAILAKRHQAVVVPVVIDGFRRAFDKKGIVTKKKKSLLKMKVKEPLDLDYENLTVEEIMEKMMAAIEQSPDYDQMEHLKKQESAKD